MKFSIRDFFSKCDQIRRKLRIWSHSMKKSLMENLIFCTVMQKIHPFMHPSIQTFIHKDTYIHIDIYIDTLR